MDMQQLRWLMALGIGALLLTACGELRSDAPMQEVGRAAVIVQPDSSQPSDAQAGGFPAGTNGEPYWVNYGLEQYGQTWICTKDDVGAGSNYVVPEPPMGYMWRLIVVKQGTLDYLFLDPPVSGILDTGGAYSHVILCKMEVPKGALKVQKKGIGDALVGGAVFTITPGNITMTEISPGVFCTEDLYTNVTYTITETTAPAGYYKDDPFTQTASPVAGTDCGDNKPAASVVFRNTPVPGKVKVYKVDGSDEPLAGVKFTLRDGDAYDEFCITNAEGYCGFSGVPLGEYTLDEVLPMGYTLGEVKLNGEVLVGGLPHTFTIGLGDAPGKGQTFTFDVENLFEDEWCSPGFWRNNPLQVAATGVDMGQAYSDFFDPVVLNRRQVRDGVNPDPTLQMVLDSPQNYGGEAFNNVGDLLSGAHPDVSFGGGYRIENSCPLPADASGWWRD